MDPTATPTPPTTPNPASPRRLQRAVRLAGPPCPDRGGLLIPATLCPHPGADLADRDEPSRGLASRGLGEDGERERTAYTLRDLVPLYLRNCIAERGAGCPCAGCATFRLGARRAAVVRGYVRAHAERRCGKGPCFLCASAKAILGERRW